jgi:hypothetical protein
MRRARYETMKTALENLLNDLSILAGEKVGPSGVSWQDVAGTAMVNAQVLADQLKAAREGNSESFITFPSPAETLEVAEA